MSPLFIPASRSDPALVCAVRDECTASSDSELSGTIALHAISIHDVVAVEPVSRFEADHAGDLVVGNLAIARDFDFLDVRPRREGVRGEGGGQKKT